MIDRLARRKSHRRKLRLPARFGVRGLDHKGFTTDLSENGIAIKTNQVFPPGSELLIRIDTDDKILTARGMVRWARQVPPLMAAYARCGMGIEFTALSGGFDEYLQTVSGAA